MEHIEKQMSEIIDEMKMNAETYEDFISGLRTAIKEAGYSESEFSEGIMNKVSLSKNLTGKHRMKEDSIEKCVRKLNKDPLEIILIGRKNRGASEMSPKAPQIPGVKTGHVNPTDVMAAVATLVGQHQKLDERMRYWRSIFENLPVSAMVIKDGVVCSQNTRSRALDVIIGKPFCENCAGDMCENKEICPINIATVTAQPASGYKIIKDDLYKLDVEFIRHNDHEYLIVLATISSGDAVPFNRRNGDRRKEKQEG